MEQYKFTTSIVKYNSNGKQQDQIVIRLYDCKSKEYSKPLPISIISRAWPGKKRKPIYDHMAQFVRMLNYLYFEMDSPVTSLNNIIPNHVLNYFETLSNSSGRDYVKAAERSITVALEYLWRHGMLANFHEDDWFYLTKGRNVSIYMKALHNKYALPPVRKQSRKLHNMPFEVVLMMFELSDKYTPAISLGLYLQVFGGLRISEVCCLKASDLNYHPSIDNPRLVAHIENRDLRPDITSSNLSLAKKPRDQRIIVVPELFQREFDINSAETARSNTSALLANSNGDAMTSSSYRGYFTRLKEKVIEALTASDDVNAMLYAEILNTSNWSSHIGRGIYSNVMADKSSTTYELATARGDSSYDSSLPYLCNTDNVRQEVESALESIYERRENAKEKN